MQSVCPCGYPFLIQQPTYKVYGPPVGWIDAAPPFLSELLIRNIPGNINPDDLLALLRSYGTLFKFRLSVNYANITRGLGLIRYSIELDALAAMELLNRRFLPNGHRLSVTKSLNNKCFYVTHIPKGLSYESAWKGFRRVLPKMTKLVVRTSCKPIKSDCAYIGFCCPEDAMVAYRKYESVGIKLWGARIAITWAHTRSEGYCGSDNTIRVRQVYSDKKKTEILNLIKSTTSPSNIRKINFNANQITANFNHAEIAKMIFLKLSDSGFSVEKPKSCYRQLRTTKRISDYSAELRLICLANGWEIPIVLFGNNFRNNFIQYGGILLRDGNSSCIAFLMESTVSNVYDIHDKMCELAVAAINKLNRFPRLSLIYKVNNRSAHLVRLLDLHDLPVMHVQHIRDWKSLCELGSTLLHISKLSTRTIFVIYRNLLLNIGNSYLSYNLPNCQAVYPKYRNKPPLNFNLNDTEIVLVMKNNIRIEVLPPKTFVNVLNENTIKLIWRRPPDDYLLEYVDADSIEFFHPGQKINVVPVWIPGHPYSYSVKNLLY